MNFSYKGIAYKQRAYEILAHETHFYNVFNMDLFLHSVFGIFHSFLALQ